MNEAKRNECMLDPLVRFLIECGVQLACIVAMFFLLEVPSGLGVRRALGVGILLGIVMHIEKRQWRRKSNHYSTDSSQNK